MLTRCAWVTAGDARYESYHDIEWAVPVHGDAALFERLCLEGAQAGLSWRTILYKRAHYRIAFDGFDPHKVARYDDAKIAALMADAGIVRNRLKIASTIHNAGKFIAVQDEYGSFDAYLWGFVDGVPIQNTWATISDVPAETPLSRKISKDLQKRGFKFVGATICYAMMQATGMVNDHTLDCFRHAEIAALNR
jgi:DNA-3-methyladenine glycosylase I